MRYIKECAVKESDSTSKKRKTGKPTTETTHKIGDGSNYNKTPVFEFPHFLRVIGPKHVKIMMQFVPSAIVYGVTSLLLLTYMAEWKTVLQYLPYYNGKYVQEIETSTHKERVKQSPEQEVEEGSVKADADKTK